MALDVYYPSLSVTVNHTPRTALSVTCSTGSKSAFGTASIEFDITEGRPYPGDHVEVFAGYNSDRTIIFSGEIDDDQVELWPNKLSVTCSGFLARTQRTVGPPTLPGEVYLGGMVTFGDCSAAAPTADVSGAPGTTNLLPAYRFCAMTDKEIVEEILKIYGITDMNIQASDFGKLAVIYPLDVMNSDDGWKVIQQIDELTGYRTYDSPDGTVMRQSFTTVPSAGGRTLNEGFHLVGGRSSRTRRTVINRVTAEGSVPVRQTQGVNVNIRAVRQLPSPLNPNTRTPIIPSPPTYQSKDYNSPLIQDFAMADAYCARVLGELCRVTETLHIELDKGDNTIYPGMSLHLNSDHMMISGTGSWFVEQVDHRLDSSGFHTSLNLIGSSASGGVSPFVPPIALFTWRGEIEYLADGRQMTVIYCDGRDSYDPDSSTSAGDLPSSGASSGATPPAIVNTGPGSAGGFLSDVFKGIAGFYWSSNFGTPGIATSHDSSVATFVTFDPLPANAYVELRVVDADQGASSTPLRKSIIATDKSPLQVRDIISAEGSRLSISRDGQLTWTDIPIPAIGTCEVGAPDYTFAWTPAGELYKVTGKNQYKIVLNDAVSCASIHYNDKDEFKPDGRCWAGTNDGKIYFSRDDGENWEPRSPLPNGRRVKDINESPFQNGDIQAISGNIYYRSASEAAPGADGTSWFVESQHPNPLLDATRMVSGFGKGFFTLSGPLPPSGAEVSRILERDGKVAGDWNQSFKPMNITGLTYAVYADRLIMTDVTADGVGRTWVTPAGSNFSFPSGSPCAGPGIGTMKSYNQTFGAPRHIIRDGRFAGVIYGTADNALFKTVDEYDTILKMKQLGDAGSYGCMIGYGALRPSFRVTGQFIASAFTSNIHKIIELAPAGKWKVLSNHPYATQVQEGADESNIIPRPLRAASSTNFFTWGNYYDGNYGGRGTTPDSANSFYSLDRCLTWNPTGLVNVTSMAVADDGTVFAAANDGVDIMKSSDSGATWVPVAAPLPHGLSGISMALAKTGTQSIALKLASGGITHSADGGATWIYPPKGPGSGNMGAVGRSPGDNATFEYRAESFTDFSGGMRRLDDIPGSPESFIGRPTEVTIESRGISYTNPAVQYYYSTTNTNRLYCGNLQRLMYSDDDGLNWTTIYGPGHGYWNDQGQPTSAPNGGFTHVVGQYATARPDNKVDREYRASTMAQNGDMYIGTYTYNAYNGENGVLSFCARASTAANDDFWVDVTGTMTTDIGGLYHAHYDGMCGGSGISTLGG